MPSMPSSASPDFTSSNLNGLMIASIFFMSGNHPPFLPREGTFAPPFPSGEKDARKYDSLQVDFLARYSRARPTFDLPSLISPFEGQSPFVTVPRELTFGPPPNEADAVKSSWYANAASRSISK